MLMKDHGFSYPNISCMTTLECVETTLSPPSQESVTEWLRCHLAKVVWETTREFEPLRARTHIAVAILLSLPWRL